MSPEHAIHWLASLPYPIKTDGSNTYSELRTVRRAPCCPVAAPYKDRAYRFVTRPPWRLPSLAWLWGWTGHTPVASSQSHFTPTVYGTRCHPTVLPVYLVRWGPRLRLLGTKGVRINNGNFLPGALTQLRLSEQGEFGGNSEGMSPSRDTANG